MPLIAWRSLNRDPDTIENDTDTSAEAQEKPILTFPPAAAEKTYIVIALDLDAPFPSWKGLGPILHWIQPGLKLASGHAPELSSGTADTKVLEPDIDVSSPIFVGRRTTKRDND